MTGGGGQQQHRCVAGTGGCRRHACGNSSRRAHTRQLARAAARVQGVQQRHSVHAAADHMQRQCCGVAAHAMRARSVRAVRQRVCQL
jgi:hypothetical protein